MSAFQLGGTSLSSAVGWRPIQMRDALGYIGKGESPTYSQEPTGLLVYGQKCTRPDRTVDFGLARPHVELSSAEVSRSALQVGDVLINSTGKGTLGRAVWFPGYGQPVVADAEITVLRPSTDKLTSEFLAYLLGTNEFYDFANSVMAVGATNQTHLNPSTFVRLSVSLPAVDQQRSIVKFLDRESASLDTLASEQARLRILTLDRYRCLLVTTMLSTIFPQRPLKTLFDDRFTGVWGGEPLGDGTDFACARVADFNRDDFTVGPDVPTLRAIPANDQARRELQHGDILLERSGGTQAKPVGCTVTWMGEGQAVCSNFVEVCRPSAEHNPRYVALLMAALYQSGQTAQHVKQTIGIQNLDARRYFATRVPVPERAQQDEVVVAMERAAEDVRTLRGELDHQLALIAERREALILAAVTGKLDIDGKAA